jgi:hypothetical protein
MDSKPTTFVPVVKTKVCGGPCAKELPASDFSFKDPAKGTLRHMCKACVRANSKKHYDANPDLYIQKAGIRNKKSIESNKLVIKKFLTGCKCAECNSKKDLHPHSPRSGDGRPAWMLKTGSEKTLIEELNKAVILCGDCLRKRTGQSFADWAGMTPQEKAKKAESDRILEEQMGEAVTPKGFFQAYIPKGITPQEHLRRQAVKAAKKSEHAGDANG